MNLQFTKCRYTVELVNRVYTGCKLSMEQMFYLQTITDRRKWVNSFIVFKCCGQLKKNLITFILYLYYLNQKGQGKGVQLKMFN